MHFFSFYPNIYCLMTSVLTFFLIITIWSNKCESKSKHFVDDISEVSFRSFVRLYLPEGQSHKMPSSIMYVKKQNYWKANTLSHSKPNATHLNNTSEELISKYQVFPTLTLLIVFPWKQKWLTFLNQVVFR